MSVLVIAGSGRKAGKTAVGCALIQAMPELSWTAVKVSPHTHGDVGPSEQLDGEWPKDTGRYLAAGAARAFLLTDPACSAIAKAEVNWDLLAGIASLSELTKEHTEPERGLLIESNRVSGSEIAFNREPCLELAVLSGPKVYWKASLMHSALRAGALVLTGGFCCDELPESLKRRRVFQLMPGRWVSPELVEYVRRSLVRHAVPA